MAKETKHIVTSLLVEKARVFTSDEMTADKLMPVRIVNLQDDYLAPPDNPRFYITFPMQIPPRRKVSIAIWRGGVWQEHTEADNSQNDSLMNFVWKWYADDSVGQYYYTYLPRFIYVD